MRGLLRIGSSLVLRNLPRLGAAGDSRGLIPLPGFYGRPAGYGPGSGVACGAFGMCLETSFLWWWLPVSGCRQSTVLARGDRMSLRSACRVQRRDPARRLPKAPTGVAFSRTTLLALPSALVGVQPTTVPGVPSRDAGKAAASSRLALPLRRAGVVSTSEAGTDDAGNVTSCKVEVLVFRTNGRLTRLFSAVRKVPTCLPRDLRMKRLTQRWNGALQGRQAYPHCGKTGSHSALPTSATASADMQIRAIFTYLTEVSGTHA